MKYDLDNNKIFFNHIMLSSNEHARKIAETRQWKDKEELEAKIVVNGVELPAELIQGFFEKVYKNMVEKLESSLKSEKLKLEKQYSDLDKEVDRRIRKIIKNKAKNSLKGIYRAERIVKAIINQNS